MEAYLPGVALITGAASGIGKGVALTFAQEGCTKLFLVDRNLAGLTATKEGIHLQSPDATVVVCEVDISDEHEVDKMMEECVATFGRVDYALNVAGVVPMRTLHAELDIVEYEKTITINEYGTWLCQRGQVRQMAKQESLPGHLNIRGSIVNVASLAGLNASSGMSTYSASKAAIIGFSKTDALDCGPLGVRINVVCPGMTDTELFRKTSPKDAPQKLIAITPVRRLGRPEDIGMIMAFLASHKAAFISGAVIPVDGGLGLQRGVI